MARTDDDSWDITEGVGATALGVAWAASGGGDVGLPAVHRSLTRNCSSTRPWSVGGGCRRSTCWSGSGRSRPTPRHARSGSTSSSLRPAPMASSRPSSSRPAWMPGAGGYRGWTAPCSMRSTNPRCWSSRPRRWLATMPSRPSRATSTVPADAQTGLADKHCATPDLMRLSRRHGRPRGCYPKRCLPAARTCCSRSGLHQHSARRRPGCGRVVRCPRFFDPEYLANRRGPNTRDARKRPVRTSEAETCPDPSEDLSIHRGLSYPTGRLAGEHS